LAAVSQSSDQGSIGRCRTAVLLYKAPGRTTCATGKNSRAHARISGAADDYFSDRSSHFILHPFHKLVL